METAVNLLNATLCIKDSSSRRQKYKDLAPRKEKAAKP